MAFLKIKQGLDIPIGGKPAGEVRELPAGDHVVLDLRPFDYLRLKLLVKEGDFVKIGDPLVEDKDCPGRMFVSPGGGEVVEIVRGEKRRLLHIKISLKEESYRDYPALNLESVSREELIERLKFGGLFSQIKKRPLGLVADPAEVPRSIFVKAVESAPFVPSAEMQIVGFEKEFAEGLRALSKLTEGDVHLVYSKKSKYPFPKGAEHHTVDGPHPVANQSVHIHYLDPIRSNKDVIWTLTAHDVVCVGSLCMGKYHEKKVISIAGNGIHSDKRGFFYVRAGFPVALIEDRIKKGARLISGDPLNGDIAEGFLGFNHFVFCAIPEKKKRKFLHFFRLGLGKFTATKTYVSRNDDFTTSRNGESRAFVDSSLYDTVMPMRIPTMHLIKAMIAKDYDAAEELGMWEVDSEDFSLPAFVCPSKIEMVEIAKKSLKEYYKEFFMGDDLVDHEK